MKWIPVVILAVMLKAAGLALVLIGLIQEGFVFE
jgi:hypothetical protein